METDEDFPFEIYKSMTQEPDFPELLGFWVKASENVVHEFYEQDRSDGEITPAIISAMRQHSNMDHRVIPYLAARVLAEIKLVDPEHPLGAV